MKFDYAIAVVLVVALAALNIFNSKKTNDKLEQIASVQHIASLHSAPSFELFEPEPQSRFTPVSMSELKYEPTKQARYEPVKQTKYEPAKQTEGQVSKADIQDMLNHAVAELDSTYKKELPSAVSPPVELIGPKTYGQPEFVGEETVQEYRTESRQRVVTEQVQIPVQKKMRKYKIPIYQDTTEQVPTSVTRTRMKSEVRTRTKMVPVTEEFTVQVPETYQATEMRMRTKKVLAGYEELVKAAPEPTCEQPTLDIQYANESPRMPLPVSAPPSIVATYQPPVATPVMPFQSTFFEVPVQQNYVEQHLRPPISSFGPQSGSVALPVSAVPASLGRLHVNTPVATRMRPFATGIQAARQVQKNQPRSGRVCGPNGCN